MKHCNTKRSSLDQVRGQMEKIGWVIFNAKLMNRNNGTHTKEFTFTVLKV